MPARDVYHDPVRNALEKDGWTITDDPFTMDRLMQYRDIVERILRDRAAYSPSHDDLKTQLIVDREQDAYLLITIGWGSRGRVHDVFGHVHITDGKVWIEQDGTEKGFAVEFVESGIPKDDIVLAFYRPERRKLTDYAVA